MTCSEAIEVTSRRRVWSEFVPVGELIRPALLDSLARHRVGLIAAAYPHELEQLPLLCAACHRAGIELQLWPMLADEGGRWANAGNLDTYSDHVHALLDACAQKADAPLGIVVDLEPPIAELRAVLEGRVGRRWEQIRKWLQAASTGLDTAAGQLRELVAAVRSRGLQVEASVFPLVLEDNARVGRGWQKVLGTPVDDVGFQRINVMLYTTVFEGLAVGWLRRSDAKHLLSAYARRSHSLLGQRVSVSLGLVGPGALGHEPFYRGVDELAEDVAIVRAAGIDDLVLHGFSGLLSRGIERWLDVFVSTPAAGEMPPPTARAKLLLRAASLAAAPLDHVLRARVHST